MGLFGGCSYSPSSSSVISLCGFVLEVLFDLGLVGVLLGLVPLNPIV